MGSYSPSFERPKFTLFLDQSAAEAEAIRSLPDLVLFNARHNPHGRFCAQTKQSKTPEQDFEIVEVTFLELAQAVERCCQWLLSNISEVHPARLVDNGEVRKGPPLALFLESDLTLFIYVVALLTLNIPCLLLSIRLNPQAIRHLLKETGSASIIVSSRTRTNVAASLEGINNNETKAGMIVGATFETFLSTSRSANSYIDRFEDGRRVIREDDRNVLILHSSGTTGLPKDIPLAHRYVLGYAGCHEFPADEDVSQAGYNLSTLPMFHGFGVLAPCLALSIGKPVWFPPSTTVPNGSLVISLLKHGHGRITSLMTVPTILEDITLMPDFESNAVPELAILDFVAVGGGGIKSSVGATLHSNGISLLNHFGATELGALAPIFPPKRHPDYHWSYLRLRSDLGLQLETVEQDGDTRTCKLIGYPFAWGSRFELQDQLEANPRKPDTEVKILGRKDDLIVLATGEKLLPHPLENALEQDPAVRRAIVFGNGQFEIGVLIEPRSDELGSEEAFIESIWPKVSKANELMDDHGRVSSKTAIIVKPPGKTIPLTDKGSVKRKEVYAAFESEISAVYEKIAQDDTSGSIVHIEISNLKPGLREIAQSCLPDHVKPNTWNDDNDFIALGMDSLRATKFRRVLGASLRTSDHPMTTTKDLPLDIIYSHPSVSSLTEALQKWLRGSLSESSTAEKMQELVRKYAYHQQPPSLEVMGNVVLITGTTGNLGANMLHIMSEDPHVRRVICLIRAPSDRNGDPSKGDLSVRQQKALEARGITLSSKGSLKIDFLPWLPDRENLGLSEEVTRNLVSSVTHIFHGAWPMDFRVKVQSMESQIKAVRELIHLGRLANAARPHIKTRVVLASSIAVVGRYLKHAQSIVVPEKPVDDPRIPLPIGYAEAKWVCEKVMESAHKNLHDIEPVILRIGQLTGSSTTGYWSPKEHFPTLVEASRTIGAMPDLQGSLSWIPVDRAARVATEVLLGPGPRELVYHLENPIRQSWPDMCTVIERGLSLQLGKRLPFPEWLDAMLAAKGSSQSLKDFFQDHFLHMSSGSLVLDTGAARTVSPTLKSTSAVDMATVDLYLNFWRKSEFLN